MAPAWRRSPSASLILVLTLILIQLAHGRSPASYYHVQRYLGPLRLDGTNGSSHYGRVNSFSHIPPVSELVGRPYCRRLSWTTSLDGSWYQDSAGHYAYELDTCRLRRLTSADALRCLADTGRTEFVGDSLTRYQFVSLIYFLTAGHYQHPYDDAHHSITWSHQWRDWDDYLGGVAELLQEKLDRCGGAVTNSRTHGPKERWSFTLPLPDAPASQAAVLRRGDGRRSLKRTLKVSKSTQTTGMTRSEKPTGASIHFSYVRDATFWEPLTIGLLNEMHEKRGVPSLLLLNPGITSLLDDADADEVMKGVDAILKQGVKLFRSGGGGGGSSGSSSGSSKKPILAWKTHTMGNWDTVQEMLLEDAAQRGWVGFDLRTITRAMERQRLMMQIEPGGNRHFLAIVYEQFNDVLLNILCDPV